MSISGPLVEKLPYILGGKINFWKFEFRDLMLSICKIWIKNLFKKRGVAS